MWAAPGMPIRSKTITKGEVATSSRVPAACCHGTRHTTIPMHST